MSIKLVSSALLATFFAAVPLSEANAGSCESGIKVTSAIWEKNDAVFKKLGCATIAIASTGAVPPNACLDAADKTEKAVTDMIKFWNEAAGNSWAKIGPRRLDSGETHQGKLVSTGGRMFITPMPLDSDEIELRFEKEDGKAETDVTLCKEYRGKFTKLWSFKIANGNKNKGKVWKKTFEKVKGHNIVVHLDADSFSNTLGYKLKLTEK